MTLESIMAVQRLSRCRGQRRRSRKSLSCSALQGSRKKKEKKKARKNPTIRLDTGRMLKKIREKDEMGIILWWNEENKEELQE